MKRIVVRPRVQTPLLVVGFTVWGLLGVTYFTEGDVVADPDWSGLAAGGVLIISGAVGVWRALRMGIVIDAQGLSVRGFDSRDRVILWDEVEAIELQEVSAWFAPVLHLRGDDVVVMRVLGSYSRTAVDQRVQQLRSFKAVADTP